MLVPNSHISLWQCLYPCPNPLGCCSCWNEMLLFSQGIKITPAVVIHSFRGLFPGQGSAFSVCCSSSQKPTVSLAKKGTFIPQCQPLPLQQMHLLRKEMLSAGQQVAYCSQSSKFIIRQRECMWEREEKKQKRGGLGWMKIQWQAFFPLLHLHSAEINAWWLRSTGVGYCPGNAFAHCTPLCLLRRNSEGICFLLFHEPHAFTLTEVDTHQLAMSITPAGWENSWLYLDPTDPAPSLADKLCLRTAIRNAAGWELHTARLKKPDAFCIKYEWPAEGAPGARPHPGSPQLGRHAPKRFAWRGFCPALLLPLAEGGFAKGKASLLMVGWVVW